MPRKGLTLNKCSCSEGMLMIGGKCNLGLISSIGLSVCLSLLNLCPLLYICLLVIRSVFVCLFPLYECVYVSPSVCPSACLSVCLLGCMYECVCQHVALPDCTLLDQPCMCVWMLMCIYVCMSVELCLPQCLFCLSVPLGSLSLTAMVMSSSFLSNIKTPSFTRLGTPSPSILSGVFFYLFLFFFFTFSFSFCPHLFFYENTFWFASYYSSFFLLPRDLCVISRSFLSLQQLLFLFLLYFPFSSTESLENHPTVYKSKELNVCYC